MVALGVGLLAYTLFGVAMALMKYGADVLATPRAILVDGAARRRFGVWVVGAVLNLAYAVLITYALGHGRASLLGALNGFGLVVLAVLSHVLLNERIGARELFGIGLVVGGTGILGSLAGPDAVAPVAAVPEDARVRMIAFTVALLIACTASIGYSWLHGKRSAAQVFAMAAGVTGGVTLLGQKFLMARIHGGLALSDLPGDALFLWLLLISNVSFALVQIAYQFGPAVVVVPVFSAAVILSPVLGGVMVWGEPGSLPMGVAVTLILVGVASLTGGRTGARAPAPPVDPARAV